MTEPLDKFGGFPRTFESATVSGGKSINPEPNEPDHGVEDAANAQRFYLRSGESMNSELIASADKPHKLFMGLRRLEKMLEDTIIPQGLSERYTPPRDETIMYEKAENFSMTIKELQELEIIVPGTYNLKGKAEAQLSDEAFLSLALKVEQKPIYFIDEKTGKPSLDEDHEPIERGTKSIIILGTPEQRAEMAKANEIGAKELGVRDVMGEHYGMRINEEIRDSYETMSVYMHSGRTPKFTTEQLRTLPNLPSLTELRAGKEIEKSHGLGEMFEEGLACQLIMLASNSKERIQNLLARPGMERLIDKMADEKQTRLRQAEEEKLSREKHTVPSQLKTYTSEQWKLDNIGDINNWVDDDKRKLKETSREERRLGLRKGLAEWSNIAAWEGNLGEFGEDKENAFIEKTIGDLIGGGKEGVEAAWLATVFMRVIGAYSTEGYAALRDGQTLLPLGEDRAISGDDFGKAYALMFNKKEGEAGRPSGLKDMIGKIPDLAINLFDWTQVIVGEEDVRNPDGTLVFNPDKSIKRQEKRRSVWDAWLGTAEKPKISLLTREVVDVELPESLKTKKDKDGKDIEDANGKLVYLTKTEIKQAEINFKKDMLDNGEAMAYGKVKNELGIEEDRLIWKVKREEGIRLGDINFKSLPRRFHGTFTIMQWLMGNEKGPTGVNIEALNLDFEYRDFRLNALKKLKKYVGIAMNASILSKGSRHLYVDPDGDAKIIQRNYFRNLMIARINSENFASTILGMTIKLVKPGGAVAEVPAPVLIRRFIKEALKPNPKGEIEIRKRYIDENSTLRQLGQGETPGLSADVAAIFVEKFEPEEIEILEKALQNATGDEKMKIQKQIETIRKEMTYVGPVTGLKTV